MTRSRSHFGPSILTSYSATQRGLLAHNASEAADNVQDTEILPI